MNLLALALLAAAPQDFLAGWNAHDVDKALAPFSDNATVTYVIDPAPQGKLVADAAFTGKEAIGAFLWTDLAGLEIAAEAPKAEKDRFSFGAKVKSEWLKRLGLDPADETFEGLLDASGKISALTISLSPASSSRAIAALPAQNKAQVRKFYEQVNRKNLAVIDDLVAPSFEQHSIMPTGAGRDGLREFFKNLRTAFPDWSFTIDDLLGEGDRVAARFTIRYVHKGEWLGIPPTGKPIVITKMDIFRLVNGKIFEHWDTADRLGMMQQLGVAPKTPTWQTSPGYEGFR